MINKTLEKELIQMPEIQACKGLWQNAFHEFDVYTHTLEYVNYLEQFTQDQNLLTAGYLHDIGKPVVSKPKIKEGKLQEREPGKPYHEFDEHENVGEQMVKKMNPNLFKKYGLDQEKIARLVGTHYLPMEAIKSMRKTTTFEEFNQVYQELEKRLDNSGCSRQEVLTMFLADKLAQGKFCTDKEELLTIRESILTGKPTLKEVYQMQKEIYGGKK